MSSRRFPSRWAVVCTSDPGNWGRACGFPAAVGPAYREQVSAAPIVVSWAALSQALAQGYVCWGDGHWGRGRLEVRESSSGAESHLLPCDYPEVLNSALGRGLWGLVPCSLWGGKTNPLLRAWKGPVFTSFHSHCDWRQVTSFVPDSVFSTVRWH